MLGLNRRTTKSALLRNTLAGSHSLDLTPTVGLARCSIIAVEEPTEFRDDTRLTIASALEKAKREIQALARTTEAGVEGATRVFHNLAGETDAVLALAGSIVGYVDNNDVSSVLPKLQKLGAEAGLFIHDKLSATNAILEIVIKEAELLGKISSLTRSQKGISRETNVLSVLTNIEIARLGSVGAGFQYLARELAAFSDSVNDDTRLLIAQTEERRISIEETKQILAAELPRMRNDFTCIDADLGDTLKMVESSLARLSSLPVQFQMCVQEIADRVAHVVVAIQTHDITRQQIEHVDEAFAFVLARMQNEGNSEYAFREELPNIYAGLIVQIYQLKAVQQTIVSWASQIDTCMSGILSISSSELIGIGPAVLQQERAVSLQLARIDQIERQCRSCDERIEHTADGMASLMHLVSEHLQRSKAAQSRVHLLMFNSIIEARHLGTQADAILMISQSIKGISESWNRITDQGEQAMHDVQGVMTQTHQVMEAFSESASDRLHLAQTEVKSGLRHLREAASYAANLADRMNSATENICSLAVQTSQSGDLLHGCRVHIEAVLMELEAVRSMLETNHPYVNGSYDAAQVERLFGASYTTEMEREILRAALRGGDLPVAQPAIEGNSVELF